MEKVNVAAIEVDPEHRRLTRDDITGAALALRRPSIAHTAAKELDR